MTSYWKKLMKLHLQQVTNVNFHNLLLIPSSIKVLKNGHNQIWSVWILLFWIVLKTMMLLFPNSEVDECDIQSNELLKDKKEDHSLIKIPPTKRKKYAQKVCVHCRYKYGVWNDTRYICTLCDIALCKEPCFAEYHCNKVFIY